jgi:hypothetical protein
VLAVGRAAFILLRRIIIIHPLIHNNTIIPYIHSFDPYISKNDKCKEQIYLLIHSSHAFLTFIHFLHSRLPTIWRQRVVMMMNRDDFRLSGSMLAC